MASLKDKVIVITGAGDVCGIGAITAQHMIQFGPKLVLTGRNKEKLDEVGHMMKVAGLTEEKLLLVVADVTIEADLERLVNDVIEKFGQIDVLVQNAAIVTYNTTLTTPMEEFDLVMRTNIRAPFYLAKLCLPYLIKTKGCIVNVSSISGQRTFTGEAPYGISKAALDQFTKILSMEVAKDGVRVNSVNPGVVRTNIQKKGGMSEKKYDQYVEGQKLKHPLGGIGEPIDVAKAITFLASDDSSFITGELLFIDGGRHANPV
ncbi:hypothetical protein ACF0H5_021232 [Mactra antiquata]